VLHGLGVEGKGLHQRQGGTGKGTQHNLCTQFVPSRAKVTSVTLTFSLPTHTLTHSRTGPRCSSVKRTARAGAACACTACGSSARADAWLVTRACEAHPPTPHVVVTPPTHTSQSRCLVPLSHTCVCVWMCVEKARTFCGQRRCGQSQHVSSTAEQRATAPKRRGGKCAPGVCVCVCQGLQQPLSVRGCKLPTRTMCERKDQHKTNVRNLAAARYIQRLTKAHHCALAKLHIPS
jgi:hypothetical protein